MPAKVIGCAGCDKPSHDMNQNFLATFADLDLDATDAYTLARNSFEASFVSDTVKAGWIAQLDQTFARFASQG